MTNHYRFVLSSNKFTRELVDSLKGTMCHQEIQGGLIWLEAAEGQDFRGDHWALEFAQALTDSAGIGIGNLQIQIVDINGYAFERAHANGGPYQFRESKPSEEAPRKPPVMVKNSSHSTLRAARAEAAGVSDKNEWSIYRVKTIWHDDRSTVCLVKIDGGTGKRPVSMRSVVEITLTGKTSANPQVVGVMTRSHLERALAIKEDSLECVPISEQSEVGATTSWRLKFWGSTEGRDEILSQVETVIGDTGLFGLEQPTIS